MACNREDAKQSAVEQVGEVVPHLLCEEAVQQGVGKPLRRVPKVLRKQSFTSLQEFGMNNNLHELEEIVVVGRVAGDVHEEPDGAPDA